MMCIAILVRQPIFPKVYFSVDDERDCQVRLYVVDFLLSYLMFLNLSATTFFVSKSIFCQYSQPSIS